MKAQHLMDILALCNPDDEVVIDMNPFGGGYRKLHNVETSLMFTESREIYTEKTAKACDLTYKENCVVLSI